MESSQRTSMNDKYVELEMVNQRLQELNTTLQQIDSEIEHCRVAVSTLEELEKGEPSKELVIPVGGETFLKVKAENVTKVRQAVGAGVLVEKSATSAEDALNSRISELKKQREQHNETYEKVVKKSEDLQAEIEKEMSKYYQGLKNQ